MKKYKFLPVFLLLNAPGFVLTLAAFKLFTNMDPNAIILISSILFIERSMNDTKMDLLETQIKELKEK